MADLEDLLGAPLARLDIAERVGGRTRFASDLRMPGMLYGCIVRSSVPHGVVRSVDLRLALETGGRVVGVCRDDFRGEPIKPVEVPGTVARVEPFPARVRFIGEAVAAVAAETREHARDAARRVLVTIDELPAVFDPGSALRADAPHLYETGNLAAPPIQLAAGDVAAAVRGAHLVLDDVYTTSRQAHAGLEPVCAVATPDGTGVTVWAVVDSPFATREKVARLLGLDPGRVRIVSVPGATYGNKNVLIPSLEPVAALLALKAGRPVHLQFAPDETFAAVPSRHPTRIRLRTAFDRDGRILAREALVLVDAGAWGMAPRIVQSMASKFVDLYPTEAWSFDGRAVHTNTLPCGAVRGVATVQLHFAMECQMNQAAAALGVDPIELRRVNCIGASNPSTRRVRQPSDPSGEQIVDASPLFDCVARGAAAFGWPRPPAVIGSRRRAAAMAIAMHTTGLGGLSDRGTAAQVRLAGDGTVEVVTVIPDKGQGTPTALAQVAAAALKLPMAAVRPISGDTAFAADGPLDLLGAEVNRGTYMGSLAVEDACAKFQDRVADTRARLDMPRDDAPEGLHSLAAACLRAGVPLPAADGRYTPPERAPRAVFAAHFAEVEVDTTTGTVRVVRYVAAQDAGRLVNPALARGQVEGAVLMASGFALREALAVERGVVTNGNFMAYPVPGVAEWFPVNCLFLETPGEPPKGVATTSSVPVAPALVSAVAAAIGRKITRLPASADVVLEALDA